MIGKLNSACPIFRTIYDFSGEPNWRNSIINKLYFDFDTDSEDPGVELRETRKFHEYLLGKKLAHAIFFSGRGFHIFVKVKSVHSSDFHDVRVAVRMARQHLLNEADVAADPSTSDVLRVARVPNTLNLKSQLFCIPISYEQLYLEKDEIEKLARIQRLVNFEYLGEEELNLLEFDGEDVFIETPYQEEPIGVFDDVLEKELPTCVKKLLENGDCTFDERYLIILSLRELMYSKEETQSILKKYLTPEKFYHCVHEEGQLDYLYSRGDLFFPSCPKIREDGFCVKNCTGNKIYLEV